MRLIAPACAAAVVVLAGLSAPATADKPAREPVVEQVSPSASARGVIVRTTGSRPATAVVDATEAALDAEVRTSRVSAGTTALVTGDLTDVDEALELSAELEKRADVLWAEPNYVFQVDETTPSPVAVDDEFFGELRNVWDSRGVEDATVAAVGPSPWPAGGYSTKAPSLWRATRGSADVVVAVLDTGVKLTHEDLAGQLVPGYDMISPGQNGGFVVANDGDGRDADPTDPGDWRPAGVCGSASNSSWHGTHVSGTIAATADNQVGVAGVAPEVKVQPVRVLGRCGGTSADIAAAIAWASGASVPGVPDNATPADVINMSLGGSTAYGQCPQVYAEALTTARANGTVVIASAGNDNADAGYQAPANCAGVVTVASVSAYGDRAAYSNFGQVVDIAAPGGDSSWDGRGTLSTSDTGTTTPGADTYVELEGTSMAAPAVSGAAALLASLGDFTPDQMETALEAAVVGFPTSSNSTFWACTTECGAGIVDLTKVPAASVAPSIIGTPRVGAESTASEGTWIGPTLDRTTEWYVGSAKVATGPTYVPAPGDVGQALTIRVHPTDGPFSTITATSSTATIGLGDAPTASVAPKRSGRAVVGGTLRATTGTWSLPGLTYAYQWQRNGKSIAGARRSTYRPVAADVGRRVAVRVTASRTGYAAGSSASTAATVVKATPTVSLSAPASVTPSARAKVTVRVSASGVVGPTGKVTVYDGGRKIASGTLRASAKGTLRITLPKLAKGGHRIKVVYAGSSGLRSRTSATRTIASR